MGREKMSFQEWIGAYGVLKLQHDLNLPHPSTVYRWKAGSGKPSLGIARRILALAGGRLELADLFYGKDE